MLDHTDYKKEQESYLWMDVEWSLKYSITLKSKVQKHIWEAIFCVNKRGVGDYLGVCPCLHGESVFTKDPQDSNKTGCLWKNELDGRGQRCDFSLDIYKIFELFESWTIWIYYSFKNNTFLIKSMKYIHKRLPVTVLEGEPAGTPPHLPNTSQGPQPNPAHL